jgi:Ca2+-binding RTX toxin-like protein
MQASLLGVTRLTRLTTFGQAGNDTIQAFGPSQPVLFDGGAGNDILLGGTGVDNDDLFGELGVDWFFARSNGAQADLVRDRVTG